MSTNTCRVRLRCGPVRVPLHDFPRSPVFIGLKCVHSPVEFLFIFRLLLFSWLFSLFFASFFFPISFHFSSSAFFMNSFLLRIRVYLLPLLLISLSFSGRFLVKVFLLCFHLCTGCQCVRMCFWFLWSVWIFLVQLARLGVSSKETVPSIYQGST